MRVDSPTDPAAQDPLRAGDRRPPERTLVDILRATVAAHGESPAIDNGTEVLSYDELLDAAEDVARALREAGVELGDTVGVRIPSGSVDLYVAILGILVAGAAYVPVDHDDPDERARIVFAEAGVAAIVTKDLVIRSAAPAEQHPTGADTLADAADRPDAALLADPTPDDDAWIIFTSGSTGTPKGVVVTHRSAAAFVDAEAGMFLQDRPIGPHDRVMAGLSVAFDASCEEMWLAWRHGACLVPAPRSLVRSGVDLGPWLVANEVTVVSTVPTLVALWPMPALDRVRLLILGGEAAPPELVARLVTADREVWNTYGPTEATVVACGARMVTGEPVRIGLPLAGWDLAVVDGAGEPVPAGEVGELIIGGVGLARYLDPVKDAEVYAPIPTLGWHRAYRSGDLVRFDGAGLLFQGRADDQVKVGGRRIELGEIDSALLSLPGVEGAAAAVRRTEAGNTLLVGYVTVAPAASRDGFDTKAATEHLRATMPAALVPRLAVVETLPTRTSGKIDRDALPWPLPQRAGSGQVTADLASTPAWVGHVWEQILGSPPGGPDEDFFDVGGGSLAAAQLVTLLRERFPEVTIADVYTNPTPAGLTPFLDQLTAPRGRTNDPVHPVPKRTQAAQLAGNAALRSIGALRWLVWIGLVCAAARAVLGLPWLPRPPTWALVAGWALLILPLGRILLAASGARVVMAGIRPGEYPRGGKVHLRVWLAERLVDELGATNLSSSPFITLHARLLGCRLGPGVDLHSLPPVTGMLRLGARAAVEPEVDLRGHWIDGGILHLGMVRVRDGARIGARSTLLPGADVGVGAEVAPGSAVFGTVPDGEAWSGAPAEPAGVARGPWWDAEPPRGRAWLFAYAASATGLALLPLLAMVAGAAFAVPALRGTTSTAQALWRALPWVPLAGIVAFVALALLVLLVVRVMSIRLGPGLHPVRGRQAWQAWTTLRVLDEARTWLYPLYASTLTPGWLRALGADIGRGVEASTVLLIPGFTSVGAQAFLADDTFVGGYELGGGWMRLERTRVGKGAFVGNSGMAGPGHKVPRKGLVAVLSAAPRKHKAKVGASYIGSPPRPLRREAAPIDTARTTRPPTRLKVARALVECCRLVALWLHIALVLVVAATLLLLWQASPWLALLLGGIILHVAGAVATGIATLAKWILVGRIRPSEHPLWSSFIWRNELADAFVEILAAAWFARAAVGTVALNWWLRSLGAKVGHGVWCESYWLPEHDLIDLRDGATIGAGCVVQTHLFHDRVMSLDTVTVGLGGTLGPNSVVLPAARIGKHATVGPVSLVMRGESVPDRTRWIGNPVGPWVGEA
ncbi:MAG TPA: amino acid adenylation domain-containing protein [Phycicoccus elongatus]|uniref:Putative non-ribosomal peptide synthetase n=2 Tax=Phycicoccus TaxID=367298 RepID=N0DYV4_9MICO|nr:MULTISPECIES: Pls/PosA family non-ribosomal peptide synthetase [Phycicoccus]MBK8729255.1 amino acid adenylation domain-containing protein [Tetrasphaera sp.]MCA0323115.1 amino acid adenylation domain-containing protein [Actinomycetota bacterium]MCB1240511.1 amino acid adenylation domain-containing protein [Tetrasphaera sp.]MCB9406356.1 amino acid adenylation domain-containing protein [Tetrasphaera sp.]CCH68525.1 putative non-ribosomal peptide synthetase [Phycicoccus elongatus Lp2]